MTQAPMIFVRKLFRAISGGGREGPEWRLQLTSHRPADSADILARHPHHPFPIPPIPGQLF